jgi:small GTP-binding protein
VIAIKNKICFLGNSGVGKSSLVSLLQGRPVDISEKRSPTVGLEIETTQLDHLGKYSIWDFGGQKRYQFMWQDFLKGAGLAILVTDSTEEDISKSKEMYERMSRSIGSKIIAIANKQDLPGALSAKDVQKKLGGIKTYGMSAIHKELRDRITQILEFEISTK